MNKSRVSRCTENNIQVLQELKNKVEAFQKKPVVIQKKVKASCGKAEKAHKQIETVSRTPKSLVPLRTEANYAAIPIREKSELIEFAIRKGAEEFRYISSQAKQRNGASKKGKKNIKIKYYQNL